MMSLDLSQMRLGEAKVEDTTTRVFVAYLPMGGLRLPLGALTVDRDRAQVELVFVQREFRRRGVARKLLEAAQRMVGMDLGDTGLRSQAGQAWARAVGLGSKGQAKALDDREAEARGNALMVPLYRAEIQDLPVAIAEKAVESL